MENKGASLASHADSALESLERALTRKDQIKTELSHLMETAQDIQMRGGKIKIELLVDEKEARRRSKQLAKLVKREIELYGELVEFVALTRTIPVRRLKPSTGVNNIQRSTPPFIAAAGDDPFQQDTRLCLPTCSDCVTSSCLTCTTSCNGDCISCSSDPTVGCPTCTFGGIQGKDMRHDNRPDSKSKRTLSLRKQSSNQPLIDWD
jgi:hypothetical protein